MVHGSHVPKFAIQVFIHLRLDRNALHLIHLWLDYHLNCQVIFCFATHKILLKRVSLSLTHQCNQWLDKRNTLSAAWSLIWYVLCLQWNDVIESNGPNLRYCAWFNESLNKKSICKTSCDRMKTLFLFKSMFRWIYVTVNSSLNCEITTRRDGVCIFFSFVLANPKITPKLCAHSLNWSAFKCHNFQYLIKYPRNSSFTQAVVSIFINTFVSFALGNTRCKNRSLYIPYGRVFAFLALFKHTLYYECSPPLRRFSFHFNKSFRFSEVSGLFVQNIIITFICAMHVRLSTPILT